MFIRNVHIVLQNKASFEKNSMKFDLQNQKIITKKIDLHRQLFAEKSPDISVNFLCKIQLYASLIQCTVFQILRGKTLNP